MAEAEGEGVYDFNPRLREGGDGDGNLTKMHIQYFNPRLREGGDLTLMIVFSLKIFQSTPPRRRRLTWIDDVAEQAEISIHASAKEATGGGCGWKYSIGFQSTPPRRRRQFLRDVRR